MDKATIGGVAEITPRDLKHPNPFVDRALGGETIAIARYGKVVCHLVPPGTILELESLRGWYHESVQELESLRATSRDALRPVAIESGTEKEG